MYISSTVLMQSKGSEMHCGLVWASVGCKRSNSGLVQIQEITAHLKEALNKCSL